MSGACTGYFSSVIHTKRVIPFGVGFSFFLFLPRWEGIATLKPDFRTSKQPCARLAPNWHHLSASLYDTCSAIISWLVHTLSWLTRLAEPG